jgi:hypothetical protein
MWVYSTSSKILMINEEYSMIDFTSRQLRAFLLVAQHRSFSRLSARARGELCEYTDSHGRGRAGDRDHSFVWTARLPNSQTYDEQVDQPCSVPRFFTNPARRQETSGRCRRLHLFLAELHRQLGRALRHSVAKGRKRYMDAAVTLSSPKRSESPLVGSDSDCSR